MMGVFMPLDSKPHRVPLGWVLQENGCWDWIGSQDGWGYGQFRHNGRLVMAHRAIYERLVGPIAVGLTLDHLCRNPACGNPAHLEPVTNRENILRGESFAAQNARRTHCQRGHPFDATNTRIMNDKYHTRTCRQCQRDLAQRAKAES